MYVVKALSFQAGAHNGVRKNRALEVRHPVLFSRHRIDGNTPEITGIHKVLQRFWTLVFVQVVVMDRVPYSSQVCTENSFTASLNSSDTLSPHPKE